MHGREARLEVGGCLIAITAEQHTALLGMSYSRPALRALLGEALTELEFKTIKARYLPLRRASGWVALPPKRRPRNRRQVDEVELNPDAVPRA